MIHEILPHRFSNRFIPQASMGEEDLILHFKENSLLLKVKDETFELPQKKDFPELTNTTQATFLFSLNDIPCFLVSDELKPERPEFEFRELGFFRSVAQKEIAWISLAGFHLANWYAQNKYCGRCGTILHPHTEERAMLCLECHSTIYPKISPAIIVAILCKNKILLARNSSFRGNWYSLIAGYADVGESLEQTVMREVKEEVGLEVRNIRYYKSQPWPLSGSMMIGFIADADENQPITIDEKEITEAAWFTQGNLPDHPSVLSIAGEMIERFEKGEL